MSIANNLLQINVFT